METLKTVGLTLVGVALLLGLVSMITSKPKSNFAYKVDSRICLKSVLDDGRVFDVDVLAAFRYQDSNGYVINIVGVEGVQLADEPIMQKFETTCK